ncbi:MAG: hypothetical protein M1827_006407 [Pycnora praestabilis]|nr:MAG: hypothetical protein M1827_006407 [Pycnora praestabilis]
MSNYGSEAPRRRHRNRDGPIRTTEETKVVRRPRDDSIDIEEVQRDFPPGGEYRRTTVKDQYAVPRRARSYDRDRRGGDDYYGGDPRRSTGAVGYGGSSNGGGRSRQSQGADDRKGDRRRRYSSSESDSESSPSPRRGGGGRRKSLGEQALAALGIGGAAGAAAAGGRDSRSRSRSRGGGSRRGGGRRRRRDSYSSEESSPERGGGNAKIQQAVQSALTAGAIEAFRSRGEPGPWTGDKGKRILTAAVGAAGVNGLVDKDPGQHGKRHMAEAVIGGLVGNRAINGPRDRSRSRGRGGSGGGGGGSGGAGGALGALGVGGLAAAAGKAFMDNRSKSKSRGRRRSYSSSSESSYDSRSPPPRNPRGQKARAKSLGMVDRGLAVVGLGPSENHRDEYRNGVPESGGEKKGGGSGSSSDSDDYISSSEEERRRKKMRGKEYLTAGLASVATIHAAHSVYQSYHAREQRHKEVMEGKMSPEEARKKKSKATLQDAASIGIAALGIKGAVSEWKEMKEQRDECHEFESKKDYRARKREERRNKQRSGGGANGDSGRGGGGGGGYSNGPRYQDGNPYAA